YSLSKILLRTGARVLNSRHDCANRKILEEVGIEVKDNLKYVHSSSFLADDGCKVIDIVFLCEHKNGEPFRNRPQEVANIYWFSTEDVMIILKHQLGARKVSNVQICCFINYKLVFTKKFYQIR
ncbi:NUDIX hydrolase, partial [Bacillus salitolerans]